MDDISLMREIGRLQEQINALRTIEIGGVWQSYTPIWTASTTNPSIGNGSISGRYTTIGNFVIATGRLVAGSTTTFGTGYWMVSVPVPPTNVSTFVGQGRILDAGNVFMLASCNFSGVNLVFVINNNGNLVQNTVPMTWATSDYLMWQIMYEK